MSQGLKSICVDFILCGPNKSQKLLKKENSQELFACEDAFQNRLLLFEMQRDVPTQRKPVQWPGQTQGGSVESTSGEATSAPWPVCGISHFVISALYSLFSPSSLKAKNFL